MPRVHIEKPATAEKQGGKDRKRNEDHLLANRFLNGQFCQGKNPAERRPHKIRNDLKNDARDEIKRLGRAVL